MVRVLSLVLLLAAPAVAAPPCPDDGAVGVLVSPRTPQAGAPVRVLAAGTQGAPADVVLRGADGTALDAPVERTAGEPWSAVATLASLPAGGARVEVRQGETVVACRDVKPGVAAPAPKDGWTPAGEDLWSAWIAHLFAAPADQSVGFPKLEPVLRDPSRNLLHDHLGLDEDADGPNGLRATPDCADLPYLLRAYFAWKVGLPFAYRPCSRGDGRGAPRCGTPQLTMPPADLKSFRALGARVADGVHSGNARTALADDATDLYPVRLDRASLRPGTVYADPYGHTLVIAGWVPQTAERGGLLFAVDAQPDQSVGRKRFWEGTFLFTTDVPAGPGFKAFRPIVRQADGQLRPLPDAALTEASGFAPFSDAQAHLDSETFHARMAQVINPAGRDPVRAYDDTLAALVEQLETRVGSVENGEKWKREHPGKVIAMPTGPAIFETTGEWEDYATPSRDFRLLIAMRVLRDLPARITRHPELFVLNGRSPAEARAEVERLHAQRVAERQITYTRSDGSPQTLTVAQLLDRAPAFETAYDPNDCVEVRWGAADGTPEQATCRRRAPADQRAKMEQYRPWFREGRRPSR